MHTRHCTFYEFQLRNNASAAAHHVCAAFGEDAVADRTWFKRLPVKVTRHWKIIQGSDVLYNLILNE